MENIRMTYLTRIIPYSGGLYYIMDMEMDSYTTTTMVKL